MIDVNFMPGRFEPCHIGHIRAMQEAYEKNKCPCVALYIHNDFFDMRHPFHDEVIEKEFELIVKNEEAVAGYLWLRRPYPTLICRILLENNWNPKLWICGKDRIDSYKKMIQENKIKELGIDIPEFFESKRYCSATDIRNAIKENDFKKYKSFMPSYTEDMFEDFRKEILNIK